MMQVFEELLCNNTAISDLISNDEYDLLYTEVLDQAEKMREVIPKEHLVAFDDFFVQCIGLVFRAEIEGFKLGTRFGVEISE